MAEPGGIGPQGKRGGPGTQEWECEQQHVETE